MTMHQPLAPLDLSLEPMQRQLFRYAQDLQEVLSQQRTLLQRHQKLLHIMGRGDPDDDLLLNTILQQVKLYLVTNAQGEILHASPEMEKELGLDGAELNWRAIKTLMPTDQEASLRQVLDELERHEAHSAIQQRRLLLLGRGKQCGTIAYDALIIKSGSEARTEIHWLMNPAKHSAGDYLEILKAFPLFGEGAQGLLMTDPSVSICAVNHAFTTITGYSSAETVGKEPRMLSSDLQELEFYKLLWKRLNEVGDWNGELFNRRKNGQVYFEWVTIKEVQNADGETVSYLSVFSDLSRRQDDTHELTDLAFHDPLTGLPNRRLLENHMGQVIGEAKRNQTGFGVLFISGDLGHGVSDATLLEVGRRVQHAVRPGDIVARVGADEFVVLLPNVDSEDAVGSIISFLLYSLDAPIHAGTRSQSVNISVGAARYPKDGDDKTTLLARAESAMVSAKRLANRYCFWKTA
jgi:diguanylate cyclase (GGDEF)-like protein/PAS domain S-box-containing protein